jgi:DNA-binding NtrC family response regulator
VNPAPDMTRFRCLMIEDDADFAAMVMSVVEQQGGEVVHVTSLGAGREAMASGVFDLVILDNRLPDGTGHAFCPQLLARMPEALVIMITGAPELSAAVALTRNGLFDYLSKPVDLAALRGALERAKLRWSRPEPAEGGGGLLVGDAPVFRATLERLRTASRHAQAIVLLLGETGTGKDMAARQLHAWTCTAQGVELPFVPLNCSAVPAEMFEAELFGSERGAYTGADRRRGGVVEAAGAGTLFLDEVGDVPMNQQTKLLRFLESREYRALGASVTRHFEGRIVAATNRNLPEEVRLGRFRQDLLYRLDVVRVELPPLRERSEDIPMLAEHLLGQLCRKYGRRCPAIHAGDAEELYRHSFPGNIRELRNVLERSLLHTAEDAAWLALDRSWLPSASGGGNPSFPTGPGAVAVPGVPVGALGGFGAREVGAVPMSTGLGVGVSAGSLPSVGAGTTEGVGVGRRPMSPLDQQEYELFKRVLIEERGAIRRTAARLGISHQVVLRRLRWWPDLREIARPRDTGA